MNKDMQELIHLIQLNKEFGLLVINGSKVTYQNETINLENFDINNFLENNANFVYDTKNLSAKAIFDILKIHNEILAKKKLNEQNKTMTDEDIKELSEKYPILKKFHIVTQKLVLIIKLMSLVNINIVKI